MNTLEHGKLRAGCVTASVAHTISTGSLRAWNTLIKNLWADDGEAFAEATGGARAFGHEHEDEGVAKFWERHPEYIIHKEPWFAYQGEMKDLVGYVGASPDRILYDLSDEVICVPRAGLEVKSPTSSYRMSAHTTPAGKDSRFNPHYAQCQQGMLVTGLRAWWFVAHFGAHDYVEEKIAWDQEWMERYIPKLRHFLGMLNEGKGTRRKMRLSDIS